MKNNSKERDAFSTVKTVNWVNVLSKNFSYAELLQEMVRLSGPFM